MAEAPIGSIHPKGRFKAFSAGSHPLGQINIGGLATLARHGLPTEGYRSQSWDEFEDANIEILIKADLAEALNRIGSEIH